MKFKFIYAPVMGAIVGYAMSLVTQSTGNT